MSLTSGERSPRCRSPLLAAQKPSGSEGEESPLLLAADASSSAHPLSDPFALRWRKRAGLLVGLLAFQSCSSFILASFEKLLQRHSVVVFFLTMLVGAGGNAGNQAAVLVIRGLATGDVNARNYARYLIGECKMALCIAVPMVLAGYVRVIYFHSSTDAAVYRRDALAISVSLLMIVVSSIVIGCLLPLLLHRLRVDPAHAGATIQVIMDLAGVCITCVVCSRMLPP